MGYRGWKVWMGYDLHISLLAILYVLIVDDLFRPLDSLIVISSIGFYFMYGFLINDFCDISYDLAVGKKRVVQELPKGTFSAIILVTVLISALHLLYLKTISYTAVYALSYILATLYSAPPVRFKSRGLLGIFINGLIEKMLPVLAIFVFFKHFGLDTLVFSAAAFSIGVVDIIAHQVHDHETDLRIGTRTFVTDLGLARALNLFSYLVAPFSGALILLLCLLICIRIPYASFIAIVVFVTYAAVFLLIAKEKMVREEKLFPVYLSSLFLLANNAFPPFLALILSIKDPLNIPLLVVALGAQYYVAEIRFKAVMDRNIPHVEITGDE